MFDYYRIGHLFPTLVVRVSDGRYLDPSSPPATYDIFFDQLQFGHRCCDTLEQVFDFVSGLL